MENFGAFWPIQECVDDLKQKLQHVTYELEITQKATSEEIMKKNDQIKKLLLLLQSACKERDEAKTQLKKLQQQFIAFSSSSSNNNNNNNNNKPLNVEQQQLIIPKTPFSPDTPLFSNNNFPSAVRANSGLTESNSFSLETSNNNNNGFSQSLDNSNNNNNGFSQQNPQIVHSHVSSPVVDSLSYNTPPPQPAVSSPDSSNNNNNNICFNNTIAMTKTIDVTTLRIESMAKGRPRPQQGKLLQAVLEAGPLLQTLMVAGSLPRWRNPPGLVTRQIPPVQLMNKQQLVNGFGNNSAAYYGQQQISPMLDFGSASHCGSFMPSAISFDCQNNLKRPRLH